MRTSVARWMIRAGAVAVLAGHYCPAFSTPPSFETFTVVDAFVKNLADEGAVFWTSAAVQWGLFCGGMGVGALLLVGSFRRTETSGAFTVCSVVVLFAVCLGASSIGSMMAAGVGGVFENVAPSFFTSIVPAVLLLVFPLASAALVLSILLGHRSSERTGVLIRLLLSLLLSAWYVQWMLFFLHSEFRLRWGAVALIGGAVLTAAGQVLLLRIPRESSSSPSKGI